MVPTTRPRARTSRQAALEIGARLARLRAAAGFTQAKFAAAAGVSKPVITRAEQGGVIPDLKTVLGIARAFGVSMHWLAVGHGAMFAEAPPGVVALAKPGNVTAFRAAVQLLGASPVPWDFALLELGPPGRGGEPAGAGGLLWQPGWAAARRYGLLLPSPLSAYDTIAWLTAWVSAGHRFRGAYRVSREHAEGLARMAPGFVAEAEAGHMAQFCGRLLARAPDRVAFPELEQVRAWLPSAPVERLEEALRGLAGQAPASASLEALTCLLQEHPEIVPQLYSIAERLL
ncbi:helix-turn-helix domain-containing protein [Nitrospira calida]|jgi:transcriptional regulator with XRE-family HTH domain